jgi:hypothetical protein
LWSYLTVRFWISGLVERKAERRTRRTYPTLTGLTRPEEQYLCRVALTEWPRGKLLIRRNLKRRGRRRGAD